MPSQHSIQEEANQEEGIVMPLELAGLRILSQEVQADGRIRVEVIGTNTRASCPHCHGLSVKQHDVRKRSKRDVLGIDEFARRYGHRNVAASRRFVEDRVSYEIIFSALFCFCFRSVSFPGKQHRWGTGYQDSLTLRCFLVRRYEASSRLLHGDRLLCVCFESLLTRILVLLDIPDSRIISLLCHWLQSLEKVPRQPGMDNGSCHQALDRVRRSSR